MKEAIKRRVRLFLIGICPYCEKYFFNSFILRDRTINYRCCNCGPINAIVKEIIDAMVD